MNCAVVAVINMNVKLCWKLNMQNLQLIFACYYASVITEEMNSGKKTLRGVEYYMQSNVDQRC